MAPQGRAPTGTHEHQHQGLQLPPSLGTAPLGSAPLAAPPPPPPRRNSENSRLSGSRPSGSTPTKTAQQQPHRPAGRTRYWRSTFLRTVGRAKRTTEFKALAEEHHVSPLLLAEYLSLCVETWSSSDGRAVFPLRRTIGDRLGCTKRHVARLRAAAIAAGFETTVPRYYRDNNGATKRTSNSSRFHIPDLYVPLSAKTDPSATAPSQTASPQTLPSENGASNSGAPDAEAGRSRSDGGSASAAARDAAARDAVVMAESLDPVWDAYVREGTLPARAVPTSAPEAETAADPSGPTVEGPGADSGRSERGRFAAERVAEIRRRLTGESSSDERAPG